MTTNIEEYKYLGYENGWPLVKEEGNKYKMIKPAEVERCRALGHQLKGTSSPYGQHEYWCDECKITWRLDSGD